MAFDDLRALLREGDAKVRNGDYAGALTIYLRVAQMFEAGGFALKAAAIYNQIREIVAKHAPNERAADAEATRRLPILYRQLGLEEEARAVENDALRRMN